MKHWMIKFSAMTVLVLMVFAISGCNTMRGLGTDIEKAGKKMQNVGKKKN